MTPSEAATHLDRATDELKRLAVNFSQRSKAEKKRRGDLEALAPMLKRWSKGNFGKDALKPEQKALLESLAPAAKPT